MRKRKSSIRLSKNAALLSACIATQLLLCKTDSKPYKTQCFLVTDPVVVPKLFSVGLFEEATTPSAWPGTSFAGGAELMFQGEGMSHLPSDKTIIFENSALGILKGGPALSQDNQFNSHTDTGRLQYTSPDATTLLSTTRDGLQNQEWLELQLSVLDIDSMDQSTSTLKCSSWTDCRFAYSRSYTPVLYYLSPAVVYYGSEVAFWIDPVSAQNYKTATEWPFTEARIDGQVIDFEGYVDESTVLNGYSRNQVRGIVGKVHPKKSSSFNIKFKAGNALHNDLTMTRCNIEGTECYKVKTLAVINSISATSGYTTGGQLITVKGYGFNSKNIDAKVDGTPCKVTTYNQDSFTCKTGAKTTPSPDTFFVGQHGLRRRIFNTTTSLSYTLLSTTPYTEELALQFEAPYNYRDGPYANIYTGYFKAPATANYRFYMTCDDLCNIQLSTTNMDPSQKTTLLSHSSYTNYRNYFTPDNSRVTAWVALTAGEYYYIEGQHIQGGGSDHFTVSVEIEKPGNGHINSMREIQRFTIDQTLTREKTNFTVNNPDSGTYTLSFLNPTTNKYYTTEEISSQASANSFYYAVRGYYSSAVSAGISVELTMYDSAGVTTTTASGSVKNVYTVTVNRALASASCNLITPTKVSGTATIDRPVRVQTSNLPVKGSFYFMCAQADGTTNTTLDITAGSSSGTIKSRLIQACPHLRDNIDIWEGPTYNYYDDGRDFLIRFTGINQDLAQFTLLSSTASPLEGQNLAYTSQTMVPYGQSIFYEPIPFEFLYTNEEDPQVIVSVDGIEAACDSLACNYNYVASTSSITDFSLSGTTLTITGTALPTTDLKSVEFSTNPCTVTTSTATQIICTVTPVAGSWQPLVTDNNGLIPLSIATTINVPLTVSAVTPSTGLSSFGDNVITISGTGFPNSLITDNTLQLSFADGTSCTPSSVASTSITCMSSSFTSVSTTALTVSINSVSDSSQSVGVTQGLYTVNEITPAHASPVLKTTLKLKVNGFTGTLDKSDFNVRFVSTTNSSYIRPLNVIGVGNDSGDKYLQVKFGGALSGSYKLLVNSYSNGKFDASSLTFEVIGIVTDFQPRQGSLYGGTLITITGYDFSTDIQDNPVKIGSTDCLVLSSTATQIKCRTQPRTVQEAAKEDFIVFLKTSEEAQCSAAGVGVVCQYEWLDTGLPVVQSFSTQYDTSLNDFTLTVIGTGFGTDSNLAELYIDGIKQTTNSIIDTQVVFKLNDLLDKSTSNILFYLPTGTPGASEILKSYSLQPTLTSLSPAIGSPAGSYITAVVKGIGKNSAQVTLVTSTGTDICASVSISTYGILECKTKALTVASNTLKVKVGTITYGCGGTCTYATSTSMPAITAVVLESDQKTLTFTGTGFEISGFSGKATFNGIAADTVTIISSTSATAVWTNGVPVVAASTIPEFYLQSSTTKEAHWATITATVDNPSTASVIDSTIQCSFAGGCQISISQPGLYSALQNSANSITVCNKPCPLSTADSSASTVKCSLPPLATSYSVQNYNIISEDYIKGTPFSSNSQYTESLFDGVNGNGFKDTAANCYFGTSFKAGHVGVLREAKYFMNRFTRANFVGQLQFQGSADGATYTTIFTVGEEIHEGWNYYNYAQGSELKYRYYRFFGTATGSCLIGEVAFRGFEVIDDSNSQYSCTASVNLGGVSTELTGSITYVSTLTPLLTSISPRYGKVTGGDTVTFSGTNLLATASAYSILIDGRTCLVSEATTTYVKCVTSNRPGLYPNPTLEINIAGYGNVATQGLLFRYASFWSDETTWGGEFAPMEGESVNIPSGLHLVVDIDSTPILAAVLVEGSLIFPPSSDPNHVRKFDAHYVMVRNGYFEVGTEQFPYTSKIIITMHGDKSSPELPIYGNKVIGVRNGILDMHGIPRTPTWTELETTASPGATTITLRVAVDWKAGEEIVIAPTGYDNTEAEVRKIVSVDNSSPTKPIITLDKALVFKHYAGVETYGSDSLEMRAEVGLLTRNVIFRGDPETSATNQYGAHIMLHSMGDESLIGRIEYCEFTDVGQAFQLGRYPLHFHLIGTVHYSYIRGNALHQTYNRAVTIHAVHYLRVQYNVAYKTMGHTFFIEDAVETKNLIEKNLAVLTQRSWSLLNTDQTPASFWITHPDNIFRGNHAAGSDRYGYWFDTKEHSMGPSFDINVCPENSPLGEFTDNVAHSNGRYGLRIFHNLIPRTNPCSAIIYDTANTTDPYWKNPLITATFKNFLGYKNLRNGAIAERVGDVRFENFKVADNILCGIEFSLTKDTMDGTAQINGALVVGHSINADPDTLSSSAHGVITPRSENFQVKNVKFYNYDLNDMAAIGSCSHCFHPAATDSGARTVTFSGLQFDSTVTKKIRYQYPFKDIFYDLDGSLTGLGSKTWATPYFVHNEQPECIKNLDVFDGLICDSTIQVRKIVFYNYVPDIFTLMEMKPLKYDDSIVSAMTATEKEAYINDTSKYGIVPFKAKLDPTNAWATPFVTGKKYKIHWRNGLDFTKMQIDLSERWTATDKDLYLIMNFTDVREAVEVKTAGELIPNMTLVNKTQANWQTGDNVIYNDTATRQIHLVINGKNATRTKVNLIGYRCVGSCLAAINETAIENTTRRWSEPTSWESGKVPLAGENVEIKSGWNMLFDLEESPILNVLQINGRLTFEPAKDLHLRAKYVFVRAGELIIGEQGNPFPTNAKITLFGEKQNQHIVYDNAIEAGNKILANTGTIKMFGAKRNQLSRLRRTAYQNETEVLVDAGLSWQKGDKLGFAPTSFKPAETDYAIIDTYDNATGVTKLDRKLSFYHFGAADSTATLYSGVDIRGEVYMMSRNIQIIGQDIESWGCQVVTSDFVEINGALRYGMTIMDNVELYNCSQYDTYKAALRFDRAKGKYSSITNSVIRHGLGLGMHILTSENIFIKDNIFFDFVKVGIQIDTSKNITLDGNHISRIIARNISEADGIIDITGGIYACAWIDEDLCYDIKLINNVVSGVGLYGYSMHGHECGDYSTIVFKNNIAHSIDGVGTVIFKNSASSTQGNCFEGSYFAAYKCTIDGAVTYSATNKVIFSNMVFIDNGNSASMLIGQEGDNLQIVMKNTKFYGETESRDCPSQNYCVGKWAELGCGERSAIMVPGFTKGFKPALIRKKSALPHHKIKSDASYGGQTYFENLQFINWKTKTTWCGNNQSIFINSPYASDYIPRVKLYGTKFENVAQDAISFLYHPPEGWANIDDCGNFPCTAPNNTLISFEKTSYSGQLTPANTDTSFQIISNNPQNANGYSTCKLVKTWNAYYCNNDNLGILLFESLDGDNMKRMITPITLSNEAFGVTNTLNTFMDHIWDGFYTGQLRLSRWPALVQVGTGVRYDISYASTPPGSQRFTLNADYSAMIIKIKYPKAGAYVLKDNKGKTYTGNAWDNTIKAPGLIKGTQCGENRYIGVENILEFTLTAGCTVYIEPIDSIQAKIRLDWTMSAFYADGGTTKFIDRMAASLGIHASSIKIVSVYQGSVILDIVITQNNLMTTELATVKALLTEKVSAGTINLGAPILGASLGGSPVKVVTDPTSTTTGGSTTTTQGSTSTTTGGTATVINVPTTSTQTGGSTSTSGNIITISETDETHQEKSNLVLIIVLSVIVGLVIVAVISGYFIYKKFSSSRPKHDPTHVVKSLPGADSHSHDSPGIGQPEEYEDQYHPKIEDIDIFSRGDPLKKQNEADSVVEESQELKHDDTEGDIENPNLTNNSNFTSRQAREDAVLTLQNFESQQQDQVMEIKSSHQNFSKTHDQRETLKRKGTSPMNDI